MKDIKLTRTEAASIEKLDAVRSDLSIKVQEILKKHQVTKDTLVFFDKESKTLKVVEEVVSTTVKKVDGKKNLTFKGLLVIFSVTVLQALGIVQIGEYDVDSVMKLDWSYIPIAILELVFILFLAKEKGIWAVLKRLIYRIIKGRVEKNVKTKE